MGIDKKAAGLNSDDKYIDLDKNTKIFGGIFEKFSRFSSYTP